MKFQYIEEIKKILEVIEKEECDTMRQAVTVLTNAILDRQSIFVFGAGHAGILSEEMFYRAGGLVSVNPVFGRELMLDTIPITHTSQMERLIGYGTTLLHDVPMKENDVLIIHSVSGRNPVAIEIANEAKRCGAKIIALTNVTYSKSVSSRHPSGLRLFEIADIVLDNHGDIGDACVTLDGIKQKVAPSSTVIGATILNSIIAATAQELLYCGMKNPPIFYSANIDGGDELNQKIYEEFKDTIHYRFK